MDPNVQGPLDPGDAGNPAGPAKDMEKYLDGVDYPASREDVASGAQANGAPPELVDQIRSLDREQFSGTEEVLAAL